MPRERFCTDTYSTFAACWTTISTAAFVYAASSGVEEAYSSMSVKRLSGSATTSRRQKSDPPSTEFAIRTYSGFSSTTPRGTCTSSPLVHIAALWAANFSSQPTSE